jgi:UDP:flavonoid glycosyltransferase YjiC (YdhE family)
MERAAFAIDNFFLDHHSLKIGIHELLQGCQEFKPDLLCSEPFHFCTSTVAELFNVPWATYGSNGLPPHFDSDTQALWDAGIARLNAIRTELHLKELVSGHASLSPYLCLSFSCPSFELELPSLPSHSALVGLPLLEILPQQFSKRPPYIVVTLGSVFRDTALLERIAEAALKIGLQVIISQGVHPTLPETLTKKDGVLVLPYINHAEWFPHAEAVVCHGGYSTTKDALSVGVPVLIIPFGSDNPVNAERVRRSGTGINLSRKDSSTNAILAALLRIKNDPSFHEKAVSMQAEFANCGGVNRAAELLLRLAQTRNVIHTSVAPNPEQEADLS